MSVREGGKGVDNVVLSFIFLSIGNIRQQTDFKKKTILFILVTVNSFSVTRLAVCDGNKNVRKVDLIPNLR